MRLLDIRFEAVSCSALQSSVLCVYPVTLYYRRWRECAPCLAPHLYLICSPEHQWSRTITTREQCTLRWAS